MNTVEFPGLGGLTLHISNVAFSFGPVNVYWYGIIIAAAYLLAVVLGLRACKKYGIDGEDIIDAVLWATPAAIIGARLYFVIFQWDYYKSNPAQIFQIWEGGLAIYGGIIGALLAAFLVARYKKIGVLNLFDFAVPYIALGQSIGRWGNFINQEAFGSNTRLPWGMTGDKIRAYIIDQNNPNLNPDIPVHPTFLYESLWNLGVFFLLLWYRDKKKKLDGEVFFMYMILYGIGRCWIEGLRTDSLMLGNLRVSQLLAGLFAVVFAVLLYRWRKKGSELQAAEPGEPSQYRTILETLQQEEEQPATAEQISDADQYENIQEEERVESADKTAETEDASSEDSEKN